MKLLLDTHIWLWTLSSPDRISPPALQALSDKHNALYLSAASSWEIAIKYRLGKLPLPEPPSQFIPPRLARDGILALPVEHAHCLAVADLPDHHSDPFDRLLIAQCQLEGMTFVTHDNKVGAYAAEILWA